MMTTYPILQSGFIGFSDKSLKRPTPVEPSFREAVIFKEFKSPLSRYKYSPACSDLFFDWSAKPELLKDFDFREKIVRAAFESFGTKSIYDWLNLQIDKPTVGSLHMTFLLETLSFITKHEPRSIQNVQWIRLLEGSDKSVHGTAKFNTFFKTGVNTVDNDNCLQLDLESFLTRWLQVEGGFEDLLISLFVIFGDRSPRTDMNNQTS